MRNLISRCVRTKEKTHRTATVAHRPLNICRGRAKLMFFFIFFFRRVYLAPSCSEFIRRKPSPFGKIRVYSAVKRVYSARTESIRSLNKFWNSKIYSLNKTEFIRQPSLFGQFPSLFGESAGLLHIISSLFGEF